MSVNHILQISIRDYYKHNKICTVKDIDHHATCPDCLGTGYKDKYDHTCPYCSGKKRILFGLFTCPSCDGEGKIYTSPANICNTCHESGYIITAHTIDITVPDNINETDIFNCVDIHYPVKFCIIDDNICKHKGSTIYYTCNITKEEADKGVCKDINIYGDIYHVYTRDKIKSYDKYKINNNLIVIFRVINPAFTVTSTDYIELKRLETF